MTADPTTRRAEATAGEETAREETAREELRRFVRAASRSDVDDRTPLLEERLLTSLHLPELILLIESLLGEEIDVLDLRPDDLRDIDTILERFFR